MLGLIFLSIGVGAVLLVVVMLVLSALDVQLEKELEPVFGKVEGISISPERTVTGVGAATTVSHMREIWSVVVRIDDVGLQSIEASKEVCDAIEVGKTVVVKRVQTGITKEIVYRSIIA